MEVQQLKLAYFSPTGTTRKVLESIAEGIGAPSVEHIDLTLPGGADQAIPSFSEELALIGAPVYGGRIPVDAVSRFKKLKGNKTLAILIVLYGNREYEDALVELKDLATESGFIPVAAGAFIGEHSYSSEDAPIAAGRPDGEDLQIARELGVKIRQKIASLRSPDDQGDLKVSGRSPYVAAGARAMKSSPETANDICTLCGTCAAVCPTAAISINGNVVTEIDQCIRCSACVKECPTGARTWENEMVKKMAGLLSQYFYYPKEPRIFGVDM